MSVLRSSDDVATRRKRKLNFFEFQIWNFGNSVRVSQPVKASPTTIDPASRSKMSETEELLVLRSQDTRGVVTLALNRPQAFNALSEAMLAELQRELGAIASDESVRVVVIAAEGKAFCAGHDLKEMRADPSLEYTSVFLRNAPR